MTEDPRMLQEYEPKHDKWWGVRTVSLVTGLGLIVLPLCKTLSLVVAGVATFDDLFIAFLGSRFLGVNVFALYGDEGLETIIVSLLGIFLVLQSAVALRTNKPSPLIRRRALAYIIDATLVLVPAVCLGILIFHWMVLTWNGLSGVPVVSGPSPLLIFLFNFSGGGFSFLPMLVGVIAFALRDWRFWICPGRRLTGTRVVSLRGNKPCTLIQSVLRNLPLIFPVITWWSAHQLLRGRPSRVGEVISGTRVIARSSVRKQGQAISLPQ